MNSYGSLASTLLETDTPFIARVLHGSPCAFSMQMRNDFLRADGSSYKWQEWNAVVTRTVVARTDVPIVLVQYAWGDVCSRTGTPVLTSGYRNWSFAEGQVFRSALLHARTDAEGLPHDTDSWLMAPEVSYPELPRTPATDLLLMASWDVLMFEALCTEIPRAHASTGDGDADAFTVDRLSGAVAELPFSNPAASAVFQNTELTAVRLGHGNRGGQPATGYGYRCLGCDLTARRGPVIQRATSTYGGTLHVHQDSGDLVEAEFIEVIMGTVTRPDGRRLPVQKRRVVTITAAIPAPVA
jgi:hypothetical protein